jgi:hypothetical protein
LLRLHAPEVGCVFGRENGIHLEADELLGDCWELAPLWSKVVGRSYILAQTLICRLRTRICGPSMISVFSPLAVR